MPRGASAHGRCRPWRRKPCHRSGSDPAPVSHGCSRSRIWMSFLTRDVRIERQIVYDGGADIVGPAHFPQRPDPLRRSAREPVGLVVDAHGDLRQGGRVLPVVMRAEQQLQAVGEQGPDVSLGAAAVTAVHGGKRPGQGPRPPSRSPAPGLGLWPRICFRSRRSPSSVAGIRVTQVHPGRPRIGKRWHLWRHRRALWWPADEVRAHWPSGDRFIHRTDGVSRPARQHHALGRALERPSLRLSREPPAPARRR